MHTIHIQVASKVATYSARDGAIVCGNDDYQVQFVLDSEWDGLAAKARFRWNGKHQDVSIVDGLAAVPRISNAIEVQVGVYSDDGTLCTTTPARVPCEKSILCTETEPTEGNEAYYASEAQEAADRAEAAAERAEAAGGTGGGSGGGVVIDPESVNQAQEAAQRAEDAAEEADQAKTAAEAAQTAAEAAEGEAAQKATEAENAAQEATTAATGAQEAKAAAEGSAGQAEVSATDAEAAKKAAQAAKNTAEQKATDATNAAQEATTAATAAQTAQGKAETAQAAAETAKNTAAQKATEATSKATAAQTAQAAAESAAAAAEAVKAEVEQKLANGDYKGEDGETPEAGVDYPTKEQVDSYIAAELAKRNQFVPVPVASVEEMTDTTKIYVLETTGELYTYKPVTVTVGGYTNLADPSSEDWNAKSRLNASAAIATSAYEGALSFVSNEISGTYGQIICIKGVTGSERTEGTATQFAVVVYDESGTKLNSQPFLLKEPAEGSGFGVTAGFQAWDAVTVTEDGVYEWALCSNNVGSTVCNTVASFRISGLAVTSAEDIIITVGEEIKDPTIETVYQWTGMGHYITSTEGLTQLEERVNEAETRLTDAENNMTVLTAEVKRIAANSSASMQSGAVWYALGDSITEGYASQVNAEATNGYDQYVAAEGKRWVDYVAALNGYALTNYGVGGTGYSHHSNNAKAQVDSIDFSGCNLVTLAYGINDFKNAGTVIGSMDDDIDTGGSFVANMRYCIKKILADNPLCKIFVITPLNYRGLGTYASNYSIGYTGSNASCENLDYMFDLMEQVCLYHGIEIIDMTHSSIVNRENIVAMLPDYVHPSEGCHRVLGYELARKIQFA